LIKLIIFLLDLLRIKNLLETRGLPAQPEPPSVANCIFWPEICNNVSVKMWVNL